jgi:predicted PurR-regulated permease PerM
MFKNGAHEPAKGVNHHRGHDLSKVDALEPPTQILPQLTRLTVSVAGVLLLFYCARSVVLPILLALVGSMVLKPPVTWLRKHHLPIPLAAALVLAFIGTAVAFGLIHLERPVSEWVKSAPETLPRLRDKYQHVFDPISKMTAALYGLGDATDDHEHPTATVAPGAGGSQIAGVLFTWTGSVLTGVIETVVLLFLLLASGDRLIDKLSCVAPTLDGRRGALEIYRQIERSISAYLFSVSLINIVFGTLVGVSLSLAGMPNAAMWGAMAAAANFVPYFGPIAGIAVVAGAGLLAFDTVSRGLLPAGTYLVWHLLEADLTTPLLLGRRFKMNAFIIFVTLMFFTWLWGILGTFLAMPILVMVNVACCRVPTFAPLAELLSA